MGKIMMLLGASLITFAFMTEAKWGQGLHFGYECVVCGRSTGVPHTYPNPITRSPSVLPLQTGPRFCDRHASFTSRPTAWALAAGAGLGLFGGVLSGKR